MKQGLRGAEALEFARGGAERAKADNTGEVGQRLKAARVKAGLTGTQLGEAMGLNKDQISKIESGVRRIDIVELASAADRLGTTVRELLGRAAAPDRPALAMAARLSADQVDGNAEELRRKAKQLLEFDDLLTRVADAPAATPTSAGRAAIDFARGGSFTRRPRAATSAREQGRRLAEHVRKELNLGGDRIGDLPALMERHFGVDVALAPVGSADDGLCVHGEGFALVLASSSFPAAHVRFTLVHELGHHLFGDPREVIEESADNMFTSDDPVEQRVNAFAGHFLMPEEGVRLTLDWIGLTAAGTIGPRQVAALMEHFAVSRQALLVQLARLDLITWTESRFLDRSITVTDMLKAHRDVAPTALALMGESGEVRAPQRLVQAARTAVQRQQMGVSVVAALLGRTDEDALFNELMAEAGIVDEGREDLKPAFTL